MITILTRNYTPPPFFLLVRFSYKYGGGAYNWIWVISLVSVAVNNSFSCTTVLQCSQLHSVSVVVFWSVVLTFLFSGFFFTLSVRVSAIVERSLHLSYNKDRYQTVCQDGLHRIQRAAYPTYLFERLQGSNYSEVSCCWKSCVQSRLHRKVYQGVRAYGVYLQIA